MFVNLALHMKTYLNFAARSFIVSIFLFNIPDMFSVLVWLDSDAESNK